MQGATRTTVCGLGREEAVTARATNSAGCSSPGTAVLGKSPSRTRAHTARRSGSAVLSVQPAMGTQWTQTMSAVR